MSTRTRIAALSAAGTIALGALVGVTAPQANAAVYYGAIALDPSDGSWGRALDYPNRAAAEQAALDYCPSWGCKIVATMANGCGAVAETRTRWGYGADTSLSAAQREARYSAGSGATIYLWACTSGHEY